MSRFVTIVAVLLFLVSALYLPFSVDDKFNTPDENANYFFTKLFAETGQLKIIEPLEKLVDNAIHPRSINVLRGFLVPEGFWGLSLIYGVLGRIFSINVLPYLTAILTIISLPFYFLFFKKFFGDKIARLSLLLLIVNPIFWYNASRNFYHNLLFVDLLVIGCVFIISDRFPISKALDIGNLFRMILVGLFWGLAVIVRPAEVFWLTILAGAIFIYHLLKKNWAILGLLSALLPLVLMFYINLDLYGGFLRFGYSATESTVVEAQTIVPQLSKLDLVQQLILPFGFHPIEAAKRFFNYGIQPVWWFALLIFLGVIKSIEVGLRCNQSRTSMSIPTLYTWGWFLVSLYLIFDYGAFNAEFFTDPGHEFIAGIGSAYLRYWLEIFVFATPFAAISLQQLVSTNRYFFCYSRKNIGALVTAMTIIVFIVLSVRSVMWSSAESLLAIQKNVQQFDAINLITIAKTPSDSVMIMPKWADRIYFPKRRVIVDVDGKNVIKIIKTLLEQEQPVFYLTGRGAIPLKIEELQEADLTMTRRFDLEEKGKMYQIKIQN